MTLSVISSDFFLPLGCVKLGRLVKSIEYPTNNYHDPSYSQAPGGTPVVRDQYKRELQGGSSASFAAKLTFLMSSGFTKRVNTRVRIDTDVVKTYTLDNSEAWFLEATNFDDTRRWIERAIGGDGIYLVVGFHTVTDARIVHEAVKGRQFSGQIMAPVGLSLAAVGVVAPLGNIFDPAVKGDKRDSDGERTRFVAPGEQVCALQYRKVSHRWLRSKKIDNLILSEVPRWTAGESWRRANNEGVEDEPDILEVELEGFGQPEGDWGKEEDEDGEILLIRSVSDDDGF